MAVQKPKIDFYIQRNFSAKVSITFTFLLQNFKPLGTALLLLAGPMVLIVSVLEILTLQYGFEIYIGGTSSSLRSLTSIWGIGVTRFMIFGSLSATYVGAVVYSYMQCYDQQDLGNPKITVVEVWGQTKKNLGKLAIAYLLYFIVTTTILSINIVLNIGDTVLIFTLGFAAIMIVFGVFWTIVPPMLVFEQISPWKAMIRSINLMSGKWFSTIGLVITLGIIVFVGSFYLSIPAIIMGGIESVLFFESSDYSEGNIWYVAASTFASAGRRLTVAVFMLGLAFQYFSIVERKENRGFLARISTLGTQKDEADEDDLF